MAYVVKAPLVQAKKTDGSYVHVYAGGTLPDDVDDTQLKQLLKSEMVVEGDAVTDAEGAAEPDDAEPEPTEVGEKPAGNASHDEWVAYAVAQGVDQEEAEALSRDQLRDRFA